MFKTHGVGGGVGGGGGSGGGGGGGDISTGTATSKGAGGTGGSGGGPELLQLQGSATATVRGKTREEIEKIFVDVLRNVSRPQRASAPRVRSGRQGPLLSTRCQFSKICFSSRETVTKRKSNIHFADEELP